MPSDVKSTTAVSKSTHLTGETSKPAEKFLHKGDFKPLPKQHGNFARISEEVVKSKNEIQSTSELIHDNRAILANCKAIQNSAGHFVDKGGVGNWFEGIKQKAANSFLYKIFKKDVQPAIGIQRNVDNLTLTPFQGAREGEGKLNIRFNTDKNEENLIQAKGTETGAQFSLNVGHLKSPKWYQQLGNWIARKTEWGWTQKWRIMTRPERLQEVFKETTRAAKIAALGITPGERDSFFRNQDVVKFLTDKKPENTPERNNWLSTEIKNLRSIADVSGDYTFTQSQLETLKKAEEAIDKSPDHFFDTDQGGLNSSEKADLEMMVLISHTAKARASQNSPQSASDIDSIILSSPFLVGPDACMRMATMLESMAEEQGRQNNVIEKNINKIEGIGKDINSLSNKEQKTDPAMDRLREKMAQKKLVPEELRKQAQMWREIAEVKGALYRYQGFIPLLAESNYEELVGALKDKLKLAGIDKGDIEDSADAIYKGLTAGSADALIAGLRIQMEENAEPAVKSWMDDKTKKLQEHLDKTWNASQFHASNIGDLGVLHSEQTEHFEAKKPLDSITSNTNRLDGIIYESKQLADALKNPDFDLSKVDHRQLPKISSQDLKLDSEVQKALIAQNDKTIKECEALKGSYKILEDLYKPDGKLHSKVRSIEDKLTGLFKGSPFTAKESKELFLDPAANEIRALREEIVSLSPNLAKDHIDHLNSFVDNLDRKAGDLKRLNDDCLSVAQGLAVPSKEFYEKRSPELQEKLKKWQERSSDLGLNDLAMFEEGNQAMNQAVQQRVSGLLKDVELWQEAWKKFSDAKDAIRGCGETNKGQSIQLLIKSTSEHMQTAFLYGGVGTLDEEGKKRKMEITSLGDFATKYQAHKADAPKAPGILGELNQEVQKARTDGTLRIFGLPTLDGIPKEVLDDHFMAKSLMIRGANVLNGRLCHDPIAVSVNKHLDKVAENDPAKRVEAFIDLMKSLQDSDSNRSVDVLRFVNTLCPPGSGAKNLGEALGLAEKLLSGKELGKARAEIYKTHIDNRLDLARNNKALGLFLSNPRDNKALLEKAAQQMPDLQKLGLDAEKFRKPLVSNGKSISEFDAVIENMRRDFAILDLNSLAGSMGDPVQTYTKLLDSSSADYLTPALDAKPGTISKECRELEALYHLAEALSDLQDSPEKTRQFKLTMALDRLTANATGDALTLSLGQENIGDKIKTAFSPIASDPGKFVDVNSKMNELELKKESHKTQCREHQTLAQGAKTQFIERSGVADLETISKHPDKKENAMRFASAMVSAQSLRDRRELDNKTLTHEGLRLKAESQHAQLEKNLNDIQDHKDNLLKYYDTKSLEAHPEKELRERKIDYYKGRYRSLDNNFLAFRRFEMGDYADDLGQGDYKDLEKFFPHQKGNKQATKQAVLNEKIFLHETNWQTVGRLTRDGGLERGIAIAKYFASIDAANLSQEQIQEIDNEYKEFEKTRDDLIGEQAKLRIQNATRAAILQECLERGMSPVDLAKEISAKQSVSNRLEQWGWDIKSYAGRDTQVEEEIKSVVSLDLDEVTTKWEREAGELRGALETLQRRYGEVLDEFTGRVAALERKLKAASEAGLESLENSASDLRRANEVRFIRSELEGITQNCPAEDVFLTASSKVFAGLRELVKTDDDKIKKLNDLLVGANESAQEIENPEAFWHKGSDAFTTQLEKGYRIVFNIPEGKELPPSVDLLIARDWLDFESVAAGYIDEKLETSLQEIQIRRESLIEKQTRLARLGVSDFMPEAFSQERTWIRNIGKNTPNLTAQIFGKASIGEILPALQKHGGPVGKKLAGDQEISAYLTQAGIIEGYFEARAFAKGNRNELVELDKMIEYGISKLEKQRPKNKSSSDNDINSLNNALRNGHEKFIKSLRDRHEVVKRELKAESLQDIETGYVNADKIEEAIIRNDWQDDRMENFTEAFIEEEDSKQILQNNEEELQIPPAKQQSFTNVSFDSFPLSDNPRPKINNSDWSKATNKPEDLKDFVHIPSQADGYCLLTSLAATRNQTTKELIADLKQAAQETGETESLNNELEKAKSAEGIDHKNIANLLNKLGIAFKEVQLTDANPPKFFASSEVPENAKFTPNSPVLLFRGGHFDLLLPKSVAEQYNLPYDGSQFIKNDVLQK